MLFDLNGNTYQVRFFRRNLDDKRITIADLLIKDSEEFTHLLVNGMSICSPKDRFEKSKGRKVALAKLIKLLTVRLIGYELTKEDRACIWEIYFKEHKK